MGERSGQERVRGRERGARRGKTDGGRRTYLGGWRRRKEKPEEKEEVEVEGRREIKMAAPASGVDPPTLPPRGNKRKKGRKLRSSAEGGRSACRGATNEATNGATGKEAEGDGRVGWTGMGIRGGNSSY